MLKTGTSKTFIGYYIPSAYKEFYELDKSTPLAAYSIKELNSSLKTTTTSTVRDK